MYTLNYHIEYNQSEKGHQWLEIVVVDFFDVYILDIQEKKKKIIFTIMTTIKSI
jgi:hypothetical protein